MFLVLLLAQLIGTVDSESIERFWQAESVNKRQRVAKRILRSDPTYADLYQALRGDRDYRDDVTRGRIEEKRVDRGNWYPYVFRVPETYHPENAYAVVFYLHGGIARPFKELKSPWWYDEEAFANDEQIAVYPAAWDRAMWWRSNQIQNLKAILERIKRDYHVDTNRVHMVGISDGGTGVYYHALQAPTPWASYISLIGHSGVLANPLTYTDGQIHPINLSGQFLLAVNGAHDGLYPAQRVAPYVSLFQSLGARVEYCTMPFTGHHLAWLKRSDRGAADFVRTHVRDPLPPALVWETDDPTRFGRRSWLVIERVDPQWGSPPIHLLPEIDVEPVVGLDFDEDILDRLRVFRVIEGTPAWQAGLQSGDLITHFQGVPVHDPDQFHGLLQAIMPGDGAMVIERDGQRFSGVITLPGRFRTAAYEPFPKRQDSGRVDLVCKANLVSIESRGVAQLTLLISGQLFDLKQPLQIKVNGVMVQEGIVEPDPKVLMKWASIDADPKMLFAAEIPVTVPNTP